MTRKLFVSMLTAALLAACTGEDGSNEAVDSGKLAEPVENAVDTGLEAPANMLSEAADAARNDEPAAPPPLPANRTPRPVDPAARPPAIPPPQPKPEEPDPHAGHDMSNMANMLH